MDITGGLLASFRLQLNGMLFSFLILTVLASTLLTKGTDNPANSLFLKFIVVIIILITVNCIFAVMLTAETVFGAGIIEGVQGRYFLPLLPLFLLLIQNDFITVKNNIDSKIIVSMVFIDALIMINILYLLVK